jgi:hypothetical protein
MFPLRWRCDAFRCSFRPFPSCIYGGSGMLIWDLPGNVVFLGIPGFPVPIPDGSQQLSLGERGLPIPPWAGV